MLFYFLEKYFLFLTAMIVFSVILYLLDITEPASVTFIYPEMDTLFNCFSETFFERLKYVHRIMESFDFLKNTFVYDSLRLFVIRILFLVYGHFGVLIQILFAVLAMSLSACSDHPWSPLRVPLIWYQYLPSCFVI